GTKLVGLLERGKPHHDHVVFFVRLNDRVQLAVTHCSRRFHSNREPRDRLNLHLKLFDLVSRILQKREQLVGIVHGLVRLLLHLVQDCPTHFFQSSKIHRQLLFDANWSSPFAAQQPLFEGPERNPAQLVVLLSRNSFHAAAWPFEKKRAAVRPPFPSLNFWSSFS